MDVVSGTVQLPADITEIFNVKKLCFTGKHVTRFMEFQWSLSFIGLKVSEWTLLLLLVFLSKCIRRLTKTKKCKH